MTLITPDEVRPPPPPSRRPYFIMVALGILAGLYILLPDPILGPFDDAAVLVITLITEYFLSRRRS